MAYNYTREEVLKAIDGSLGIIEQVARKLGCEGHTAKNYIEKWALTINAMHDEKERILDIAESKLFEAIMRGEAWAIKFFLMTKGQSRGYISTPTIKLDNGEPLNITFSGMSKQDLLDSSNVEVSTGAGNESEEV